MEMWIATGNKGKLGEFQLLLRSVDFLELHHQGELSSFSQPPENGKTFLDNARIKAKALRAVKNKAWVLADDSGLEVEGLGGLPGIHSARYAGDRASDAENVAKLLKMMQIRNINPRTARFVCSLVVITDVGEEWNFQGELKGKIGMKPQGQMGFGYDPVFIPDGESQTLAELPPGYKNQHSHRAKAVQAFLQKLRG